MAIGVRSQSPSTVLLYGCFLEDYAVPNKRNKQRKQWVPRKSDAASVPFSSELSNSLPHSLSHCEKGCDL